MKKDMKRAALFLAGVALTASAPAFSGEGLDFRWSASELTTADGVTALHERIDRQARNYCFRQLRGTREISRQQRCTYEVAIDIVRQIDSPVLTEYAATGRIEAMPAVGDTSVAGGGTTEPNPAG